jgi:hypothetical protein
VSHEAVKVVQRGRLAALRRWWDTVGRVESDRGLYLALAELTRRANQPDGAAPSPLTPLTRWELRVFSQNGEDGVLAEIFRRIGSGGRYFVEFGIESGREGNSVYLADVDGWSGLFIEADPQMFDELQGKYRATDRVRTARSLVTPDNIERLLTEAGVPEEPDLLSIDIDGQDYWIWEAICAFRPRVVVIEYNSRLDPARPVPRFKQCARWGRARAIGSSTPSWPD